MYRNHAFNFLDHSRGSETFSTVLSYEKDNRQYDYRGNYIQYIPGSRAVQTPGTGATRGPSSELCYFSLDSPFKYVVLVVQVTIVSEGTADVVDVVYVNK